MPRPNKAQAMQTLKQQAREQAKAVRQKLYEATKLEVGENLSRHLLALLNELGVGRMQYVAAFWPMGSEIDCRLALSDLARAGYVLCLPCIEEKDQPLIFRHFELGDPLVKGVFNTMEPVADAPKVEPDVILTPLLAFDQSGNRLGYGGGFYDTTITKLKARKPIQTIGLAFAEQKVRAVPINAQDQPLDYIITECGLMGGHVGGEKNK